MQTLHPVPPSRRRRAPTLAAFSALGLASLLTGCGTGNSPEINAALSPRSYAAAAGNWKFTSGSAAFAGALAVSGSSVTATLHSLNPACAAPTGPFTAFGSISTSGLLSITSGSMAGVTFALTGTLAADQHSLSDPTLTLTGGACATPTAHLSAHIAASPTAQQYQPLTGNYNGTFTDSSGASLAVAASLSQPTTPDANGVYHLTGYATFPNTPCLNAPVITDSTVTGDSIQATYTDSASGGTVVGNGTFSSDAQTLTITNWILSGCGDDTGTGLLLRHQPV